MPSSVLALAHIGKITGMNKKEVPTFLLGEWSSGDFLVLGSLMVLGFGTNWHLAD